MLDTQVQELYQKLEKLLALDHILKSDEYKAQFQEQSSKEQKPEMKKIEPEYIDPKLRPENQAVVLKLVESVMNSEKPVYLSFKDEKFWEIRLICEGNKQLTRVRVGWLFPIQKEKIL